MTTDAGVQLLDELTDELLFAANIEGVPVEVSPDSLATDAAADANAPAIPTNGWEPALTAPDVDADTEVTLANADAVVWRREP
ncbi:hypothetical protein C474_01926 [Halogeometricum pallidum JCM 14848]|uniref:Uncharacterized protein n=1 Tax=Halogeometricum pallidum JCM 14848 TaxID=1227487 RepID=M0DG39_HALPD|nr:hypothetical protein C474_01926 [Halogeometricum pallidum JCM 14848]